MSIQVQQLEKSFGKQAVLRGLDFEARPGRVLGFLGPNGAGKSTCMRIMAGVLAPDSGSVLLAGEPVNPLKIAQRRKVGYLAEQNSLYLDMYVWEFLEFVGRIHQLSNLKKRIGEVIQQTGLEPEQHKQISFLSKGYKQRVGLAQAIIHNPEILILDEPTAGLDPNQLIEIRHLIRGLAQEKTVLLSSHLMQEVEAICDDIAIIHQGHIVVQGALSDLLESHHVPTAEALFVKLTQT